jgi:hypothetical protein
MRNKTADLFFNVCKFLFPDCLCPLQTLFLQIKKIAQVTGSTGWFLAVKGPIMQFFGKLIKLVHLNTSGCELQIRDEYFTVCIKSIIK